MVIGYLDISNYTGISIGAVHWYGKLYIDHLGQREDETIELLRKLTAREVAHANREAEFQVAKVGDLTHKFDTEQEALDFGINRFKSQYKGFLIRGSHCAITAWHNIIVWPPHGEKLVAEMNEIAKRFQAINGHEGQEKRRAERLDNRWCRRYNTLRLLCKP